MLEIQILIDYLTLTTKIHTVADVMSMLGVAGVEFEPIKSFLGYRNCLYYEGIRIHWTDTDNLYEVCVDLSGKGCRTVEFLSSMKFDWFGFFKVFQGDYDSGDVHIPRLDIACDDFEGYLDYARCCKYVQQKKYICKSKLEPWWTQGRKEVLYFGSEHSDRLVRIYNKLLEQRSKGNKMDLPPFWVRCEMQMRDDAALSFVLNWFNVRNLGKLTGGVFNDYLRFISAAVENKNYGREKIARWWLDFIGTAKKIKKICLQGRDYTMADVYENTKKQCASGLATLVQAHGGGMALIEQMANEAVPNKRQKMALKMHEKECEQAKERLEKLRKQMDEGRGEFFER